MSSSLAWWHAPRVGEETQTDLYRWGGPPTPGVRRLDPRDRRAFDQLALEAADSPSGIAGVDGPAYTQVAVLASFDDTPRIARSLDGPRCAGR